MTGQLFGDRYQVGDTLGFGGMSEVHRGRDLRLGRDVAIKVLRADLARDSSFLTRFRREAQNAASLNHPAIVAVFDTGEMHDNGEPVPYIVMEYVDGKTLRETLKAEGPLPPKKAMEILADVCAALDFSHRHGIIHRDVKPANIMLTRSGAVKVMDFGIARAVSDGSATVTATAAVIGTAQYLSPEQARGEAVDARSDVYAAGCVLYELLTGAPPFTGDSPVAVAYQHVKEDARPPSESQAGLPRELDAIVLKALNKNPLNRYQSAAEMRADLVRALSGQAVQATPVLTDAERTELMGAAAIAAPRGIDAIGSAAPVPLLAPPQRVLPRETWEDDDDDDAHRNRKLWGWIGAGTLIVALLAGAVYLVLKVIMTPAPPPKVAVPDVSNKTQVAAAEELSNARLRLGETIMEDSTDDLKGKVLRTNPSALTQVDQGTMVTLVVGRGVTEVTVPNLATYTQNDAKEELRKNQLEMTVEKAESTRNDVDKVLDQNPKPNKKVKPGSTVTVIVGNGPSAIEVPTDLGGHMCTDAKASLEKTGFQVAISEVPSVAPKGQIVEVKDPTPGSKVDKGSVLTLHCSDGSQFTMISLHGMTVDQAASALKDLGWSGDASTFGISRVAVADASMEGKIVGQTQAADSAQPKTVKISVQVGERPKFKMPDLKGKTVEQAQVMLAGAPFNWQSTLVVQETPLPPDKLDQAGKIFDQSVRPNTTLSIYDNVTVLVYSKEPKPGVTPSASAGPGGR